MSDLKAYLAANYMSGPKADAILARSSEPNLKKKKKKKPKNEDYIGGSGTKGEEPSAGGILLKDEDESWIGQNEEDEDVDGPMVGKELATFKKSKNSWATVADKSALPLPEAGPSHSAEDEQVQEEPEAPPVQMTKRRGGLRTYAQLKEDTEREKAAQRSASPVGDDDRPDPTATVYRDASGRVIDMQQLKEEEKRAEEEERRKEAEKKEWTKGLQQRREREERARLEREMADADVGRTKDDVRMNNDMKDEERWNDPAAAFLTKRKKKGPRRPKYQGPWTPNRFGIPPGFRWDGVDRSNGFEKKFFQAQNTRARNEYEHNQWSVEDM
ncbi:pre-mRNA-splicing factor CWC26 [Cryptococcus wingfieldii CBS 7118]|uniref:Pre-mRNA-splicing factor CWC26 n=1 Tax=Cryptococcus wingfieldii CBS 7118 TaxID=1295528 RepID=A0A1E3JEH9_9TREE|nr:pre-mRNA-splicing factor CWC26 [Cryptococcus wingfieldii CBS 7118]ODN98506.1 pre-mRNA-splicing factor CWC26 [Cryptococcus wingfieldii CBS 7118]